MSNFKAVLHQVFPSPIISFEEKYTLSKSELKFINILKKDTSINGNGNLITLDQKVLENKPLKKLKQYLTKKLNYYFYEALEFDSTNSIYITGSWINYNSIGTSHHVHRHANSFMSGVFYIQAIDDSIVFHSNFNNFIMELNNKKNRTFSENDTYTMKVNTGETIIFPSTLKHGVPENKKDYERISLSFNTFIKGRIGDPKTSTLLEL